MGLSRDHDDTIVAIASPRGSATRGIVRASGPRALHCVSQIFDAAESTDSDWVSVTTPTVVPGKLNCGTHRVPGKLLVWPTSQSFTKQPSIEFHTFGSQPVLELATKSLCDSGGRLAEPGEFTMRAFLSGRLDLTQAEAVLAVIDAKNQKQLGVAIDQLAGGIGSRLNDTRDELIAALAELEAGLDFVDEDIEFISNDAMIGKLEAARDSLARLMSQASGRDRHSGNFRVSFFGLPLSLIHISEPTRPY